MYHEGKLRKRIKEFQNDSQTTRQNRLHRQSFGYVGLPLALAFLEHLTTIGFDVDAGKIKELAGANDNQNIAFTDNGFTCGTDFTIGYSPERINPGDDNQ
ncbi:MAG: hypothetical protein AEth_01469 [Candidatus Argoarchaeum ethanivorans]|uniref:UDP-glucose/GDP-mannose dehydrogenase N-terminal domain-containing protein n=1 Tax=Candidatus Argoarchaeum ethanivorans TaxID=2608793 RepID=A0A8B3S0D1_9EURY|nr:MAG: hypothetical protein AEth_01469 [Candidatus Argoarchaeum ethanivorans]